LVGCRRLGRLSGRGGPLIEGLAGGAIERIAGQAALALLDSGRLDAKELKGCLADLQALPAMPVMADKMNLAERFWFLETIMILDRDGLDYLDTLVGGAPRKKEALADFFARIVFANIDWDPALRNGNQMFDRMA